MLKYVTMFAAALSVCVSAYADDETEAKSEAVEVASFEQVTSDADVSVEASESNSNDTNSAE